MSPVDLRKFVISVRGREVWDGVREQWLTFYLKVIKAF